VYEYTSYKPYLSHSFGGSRKKTGRRAAAARQMGCQTTYLSQVLHGKANLSLEQGYALNSFLGHDTDESEYLLLLIQKERAGTPELREYFVTKLKKLIERKLTLRNRIQAKAEISPLDQAKFYSHWYFAAIHVLLSIPALHTKSALVEHLNLPLERITEALEFLQTCGLVVSEGSRYQIGPRHMHLSKDSPNVIKHHANWRMRAIQSLDQTHSGDLHYSVVVSLSREDVIKIKSRLLQVIDEHLELVAPSKEEVAYAYTIDFFEV
jgi:uncharacterized protein (TIGR02147 family)